MDRVENEPGALVRRLGWFSLGLGAAQLGRSRPSRNRLVMALAAVGGVALLDVVAGARAGRRQSLVGRRVAVEAITVRQSITVNRRADEVYAFWRNLENLPRFMAHVESVELLDERRSRWRARSVGAKIIEWDAQIVEEQPGRMIAWASVEGSDIASSGLVRFAPAPGARGTEVHLELLYHPPFGRLGAKVARLLGREPGPQVRSDLRRFKQLIETGEVVRS